MRGSPDPQLAMLSTLSTEDLIPADHPIRRIRAVVDTVLVSMDDVFDGMYSARGRPSVPPEMLLKATVLMAMYAIWSERAFCERLNYDLLFKWFLYMPIDAKAFDATTFTKNRSRLLEHEVRTGSSPKSWPRPSCAATCRRSTSRSTGRCWRRGHRTSRSSPRTSRPLIRRTRRRCRARTSSPTSTARSGPKDAPVDH